MLSSYYLPGVCLSIVSDDENEENVTPPGCQIWF